MLCVYRGFVCYLKYHVRSRKWKYIRQSDWDAMSFTERHAYVDDESEAYLMDD